MNDIFDELVSSNYWNGKLPKVEFARKSYTNRIFGYVGNRLVKVLTGQRGVGKGCLLRQIIYQLIADGVSSRNILYISKKFTDSGVLSGYRDLDDLLFIYREKIHPVGKVYIFIEEIQKVEGWEHFVHSHSQDFVDTCELFISGSNQDMLSGEAEKLLARHYVSFEIFPFSFSEHRILERVEATGKNYAEYMGKGALPILFNLPDAEAGWKAISALRDTILFRDIIRRYRIKDARLLEIGAGRGVKTLLFQSECSRCNIQLAEYDALDLSVKKLSVLEERVVKAGGSIASALAHDATKPLPVADEAYDLIFIDAPCTGLGTLRRHPEIKARLHKEDAKKLSATSQAMLVQAAPKVKLGGYLMFATCTILKEENEKTVKRFLASPAGSAFEIVPLGAQGTPFFKTPFDTGADLHFAALLQKKR